MRKSVVMVVLCLMIAVLFAGPAQSGEVIDRILKKGELVVGTSGNQPPLIATTKDGKLIGLDADLARIMAGAMGVKVKFETMSFTDLLPALESGKVDVVISGMTITPKRNLKTAFVGPYFVSGKSMVLKREKALSLETPEDLNSAAVTLAVLEGSTSQEFVENLIPKAVVAKTKTLDEALKLVIDDKATALIADYPYCAVAAYRNKDKKLVTTDEPFTFEPLGIALPSNDPLLVNWVENYLTRLEGGGTLLELTGQWFKDPSWIQQLQ